MAVGGLADLAGRSGVLLHHWDTDGITSAVIIERHCEAALVRFVPTIGHFYLDEHDLGIIRGHQPDFVIVADMSLPEESLLALKDIAVDVLVLDHHQGLPIAGITIINPIINGQEPDEYPSAGWVINEHLGRPQDILSVLGAIGDCGQQVADHATVVAVLAETGLSFGEASRLIISIDSCYVRNDLPGIHATVAKLKTLADPKDLLADADLVDNLAAIEMEIERLHAIEPIREGVLERYDIATPYILISRFTRELAKASPGAVIMTVDAAKGTIYVRRTDVDVDLSVLIPWGKARGYSCGGKREVLGLQSINGEILEAVEPLTRELRGLLS